MDIRIVSAVTHNDTGELEVILETEMKDDNFGFPPALKSVWIDKETLLEMAG